MHVAPRSLKYREFNGYAAHTNGMPG
jgi:hypothetical protein